MECKEAQMLLGETIVPDKDFCKFENLIKQESFNLKIENHRKASICLSGIEIDIFFVSHIQFFFTCSRNAIEHYIGTKIKKPVRKSLSDLSLKELQNILASVLYKVKHNEHDLSKTNYIFDFLKNHICTRDERWVRRCGL